MSSSDSKEDLPESGKDDPAGILDYEDSSYGISLFQNACIDYAAERISPTFPRSGEYCSFNGQSHVAIALLSPDEVRSQHVSEEATFVGLRLGPQGHGEICEELQDGSWTSWAIPSLFLRHPAELADVRNMLTGDPFKLNRTQGVMESNIDKEGKLDKERRDEQMLVKAVLDSHHILYGTQVYDFPLETQYKKGIFKLSELVTDVFLLIEEEPFKGFLLPLAILHEDTGGKELLAESTTRSRYGDSTHHVFPFGDLGFHWSNDDPPQWKGDFGEFQHRLIDFAETRQDQISPVSYEDVVISYDGTLTSPQTLGMLRDNSRKGPKLVARLNPETVSLMRFLDLASCTIDLRHILTSVEKSKTWDHACRREKIELESDPLDQVRSAVSFRNELRGYEATFRYTAFFSGEEAHPPSLDKRERRYQVLDAIHHAFFETEGYKDYLSPPPPELPHFLEIAYRRFQETQTASERLKQSMEVFNLVGRSLLFLMLEDIRAVGIQNEEITRIEKRIREGRVSEGAWINFQKELINIVRNLDDHVVEGHELTQGFITKDLMETLSELLQLHMVPLVEARNRYAHPPYDDIGFLREAEKQIPHFIHKLRKGFQNIEILVPENFETDHDDDLVVNARSLMGHRFEYPLRKILNCCPGMHKDMPTKKLLLCRVFFQSGREIFRVEDLQGSDAEGFRDNKDAITPLVKDDRPRFDVEALLKKSGISYDSRLGDASAAFHHARIKARAPRVFRAAPLNILFNAKTGYKEMLMTGIFRGMEKGRPEFQYVEDGDLGVTDSEG